MRRLLHVGGRLRADRKEVSTAIFLRPRASTLLLKLGSPGQRVRTATYPPARSSLASRSRPRPARSPKAVTALSEFGPTLDRLYTQILTCLDPGLKPRDCRPARSNAKCPAIQACVPGSGFIDPVTGGCQDGLHFVTGDIFRLTPGPDVTCTAKFGFRVDIYLFPPCKDGGKCHDDPGWSLAAQWGLMCCVYGLDVAAAWAKPQMPCRSLIIDPRAACINEGLCKGVKMTVTVPIP